MIKTVMITGGSRGIGRAAGWLFASHGWNVAFTYRQSQQAASALERELNTERPCCLAVQCDVSSRSAVRAACEAAADRFGRIDALVNNAGCSSVELFQDATDAEIEQLFRTNVFGSLYTAQAVLPDMIARREGVIVNVSSMWGLAGAACEVVYSCSKAAVIGFTKALAKEVAPSGIRVNCVAPGAVETDMLNGFGAADLAALVEEIPLGRLGQPGEVAEAIYYLASSESAYLTGQVLSPNGGLVI